MNNLSGVMKQLRAAVESTKKGVFAVAERLKEDDPEVAEYAGDTVVILGEIESAMETAEERLLELEKAEAFVVKAPRKPSPEKAPLLRSRQPLLDKEVEADEDEGRAEDPSDREPERNEPEELSGEAINAIFQHVDAEKAHEEAMKELAECQAAAANPRPGQKREAGLRLAAAQAKVLETWTAKKETYALQELLADRARSG